MVFFIINTLNRDGEVSEKMIIFTNYGFYLSIYIIVTLKFSLLIDEKNFLVPSMILNNIFSKKILKIVFIY